ncbi:MAG TPA: hypothetical protein VH229_00465 [Candidatus Udaeobacter sp.]|jgi:hypothetical protein|nr:hypothetical protein [Candidatus Udaeobacter sp.]
MKRLYFGDNFKWLSDRKEFPDASVDLVYLDYPRKQTLTIEGVLNGTERIDAPNQLNPFAMAAREQERHEQGKML